MVDIGINELDVAFTVPMFHEPMFHKQEFAMFTRTNVRRLTPRSLMCPIGYLVQMATVLERMQEMEISMKMIADMRKAAESSGGGTGLRLAKVRGWKRCGYV